MAQAEQLKNPPIAEALIDIRVEPPKSFDVNLLVDGARSLGPRYPRVEELFEMSGRIHLQPGAAASSTLADQRVIGAVARAGDGLTIAQFRWNGFTLSRLAPYQGWDALRTEGIQRWIDFRRAVGTLPVQRIALRYINRIEIDSPLTDLAIYLTQPPLAPNGFSGELKSAFQRAVAFDPARGTHVIVQHALEPASAGDRVSLLFDIDVFVHTKDTVDDAELSDTLEELHRLKNDVFFAAITPATKRRFE